MTASMYTAVVWELLKDVTGFTLKIIPIYEVVSDINSWWYILTNMTVPTCTLWARRLLLPTMDQHTTSAQSCPAASTEPAPARA